MSYESRVIARGVTLLELILVIALIAIIGASVSPFLSNFILRINLETTTDMVVGTLRKAQSYSMDGKNNTVWGVCLSGDDIRLFTGSCSVPSFSEDFSVPATVNLSGLSATTFSKLRGEPSSVLSITVNTEIHSRSVQLNKAGGMELN